MHSQIPATNTTTTPFTVPTTTPATGRHQHQDDNTPDHFATDQLTSTRDFHLDTFFNPVWMSGPNVFSFAKDGTVVRPETYTHEPYPGYQADGTRRREAVDASHFQGSGRKDPKPWKNVAITEQDDAELEEFLERMRVGAIGEFRQQLPYGYAQCSTHQGPGRTNATWPTRPYPQ